MIKDQMEKIYRSMPLNEIPWNTEIPPELLQELVETGKVKPCKAIELGCGAGNYVIYLAKKGFDATGVDFAETAVEIAKQSALRNGVWCKFITADVLGNLNEIPGKYDFVYDWDLLHHIFPQYRRKYLENVCRIMKPEGYYFSVCFSEESPQFGGKGKYRKTPLGTTLYFSSKKEMQALFGQFFNLERLEIVEIKGKKGSHQAIYALMKKK